MDKIKNFDLTKLGMKENLEFHRQVYQIVEKASDLEFRQHVFAYREKIIALDEACKQRQKAVRTKEVASLDKRRDRAYSALVSLVFVGLMHFDKNKAEAARQIQLVLKKYGNPTPLSYPQESDSIHQLVVVLEKEKYAPGLAAIHATEWLEELVIANKAFMEAYNRLKDKKISMVTSSTSVARKEVDHVYRSLIKEINLLLDMHNNSNSEKEKHFSEQINSLIEKVIKDTTIRKKKTVTKT